MKRVFYEVRWRCKEEILVTKNRKPTNRSQGKPILYPTLQELTSKTFRIKYDRELSVVAKFVLTSLQKKYLYYAIDDLLYLFRSNSNEQDHLLATLYSPVLSLQNNFSINFFDIWIHQIHINDVYLTNKFLSSTVQNFEPYHYITIKFLYLTKIPKENPEPLW